MSARRRRKRSQPQHLNCESSAKRQEFFLFSSKQHAGQNSDVAPSLLGVETAAHSAGVETSPDHVSPAHQLINILPPELTKCLDLIEQPQEPFRCVPLLHKQSSIVKPALCIGRVALRLTDGTDLNRLITTVSSTEPSVNTQLLVTSSEQCYLQLSVGGEEFYLPLNTIPQLDNSLVECMRRMVRSKQLRLLLCPLCRGEGGESVECRGGEGCGGEMEGGERREEGGGGRGGGEGGGGGGEEGVAGAAEGVCGILGGGAAQESFRAADKDGSVCTATPHVDRGGGMEVVGGGVEVEVWVCGTLCEPGPLSELPARGQSVINCRKVMKVFHPAVFEEESKKGASIGQCCGTVLYCVQYVEHY